MRKKTTMKKTITAAAAATTKTTKKKTAKQYLQRRTAKTTTIIIIIIIIMIIKFKGAIRDFLQSPHSAANCLQHERSSGPDATVCNTSSAYRVQVSCYVPLGTKGQLSY